MHEVGVVGGLGPAATAAFLGRVVSATDAAKDQDHVNLVVLQHSAVPDRTDFITGASDADPTPLLVGDAVRLASWGVVAVVMPCNTATAFVEAMRAAVTIPVLDIVDIALDEAATRGWRRVGVLATEGTRAAATYDRSGVGRDIAIVYPSAAAQLTINSLIFDFVKAGKVAPESMLESAIQDLIDAGVDGVILGCTELSVAAEGLVDSHVVDALDALARRTVIAGGGRLRAPAPNKLP